MTVGAIKVARSMGVQWNLFERPLSATARTFVGEFVRVTKGEVVVGQRFALVAIAFATGALALGWRRHHSRMVATFLLLGIVGLVASRLLETGAEHHSGAHTDDIAHAASEQEAADVAEHHASDRIGANVSQVAGAGVGVLAGFLLLTGHLLNLRVAHRGQRGCERACMGGR